MSERIGKAILVLFFAVMCGVYLAERDWLPAFFMSMAAIIGMIRIHIELAASPVAGTGEKEKRGD